MNDVPRLIIPADSSTAFVRLPCVVLMVALVEGEFVDYSTIREQKADTTRR